MVLRDYMASMDSGDADKVLAHVEPDFRFLIALPGGAAEGSSRADFARYLAGRKPVARVHHILRAAVDGDLEMAYGVVTEAGTPTGAFQSSAVVSPDGRMARYQSFFTTSFELYDWPATS